MKLGRILGCAATVAVLGLVATTQSGCLAAAVGAGVATYAYVDGQMSDNVDASVAKTAEATKAVFSDMKATIYQDSPAGPDAKVYARTTTDHRIEVLIRPITENASKISIRVDNFGDEGISRDTMNQIKAKLK